MSDAMRDDAPERIWTFAKGRPVYSKELASGMCYVRLDIHEAAIAAAREEGRREERERRRQASLRRAKFLANIRAGSAT